MNSALIFVGSILLLAVGYKYYNKLLKHLFDINDSIPTPAHSHRDGCDFMPAEHWTILFGHHFASIAGAGPIIGPVLAVVIWGWVPTLVWIILGAVLIGGVHDFGALILSVKHKGSSIADVTKTVISKKAKIIFGLFIWLALILVDAIFILFAAKTFVNEPSVIVPAFGLIPVAIAVGYLLYIRKVKQLNVTIFGLACLLILILLGPTVAVSLSSTVWALILLVYCYIASVTPVHILLQPRDYLSGYLLLLGILFGGFGIIVTHPTINVSLFSISSSAAQKPLWPMLFVTVACGAISGFHSLVASGTTSKQLDKESDSLKIGYGAMIMEAVLAVIALIAVAAGLSNVEAKGFIKSGNPIGAFGAGYGALTSFFLGKFGKIFALVVLNAFVLTTLDSATRITRYLTQEIFGLKNRHLATLIVVVVVAWLALSGEGNKIWPVFGASNQLVAALTFIVISAWLLQRGKNIYFTIIPTLFMLVTTLGALFFKANSFLKTKSYTLASISIVLGVLAFILIFESIPILLKKK